MYIAPSVLESPTLRNTGLIDGCFKTKFKSIHVILFQTGENATEATEMINSAWEIILLVSQLLESCFQGFVLEILICNPRQGPERKFEDEELQALLNENPCQTQ